MDERDYKAMNQNGATVTRNVPDRVIIVYAKIDNKLVYFRMFDYPSEEKQAHDQFKLLMKDKEITDCRMIVLEELIKNL